MSPHIQWWKTNVSTEHVPVCIMCSVLHRSWVPMCAGQCATLQLSFCVHRTVCYIAVECNISCVTHKSKERRGNDGKHGFLEIIAHSSSSTDGWFREKSFRWGCCLMIKVFRARPKGVMTRQAIALARSHNPRDHGANYAGTQPPLFIQVRVHSDLWKWLHRVSAVSEVLSCIAAQTKQMLFQPTRPTEPHNYRGSTQGTSS